MGKVLSMSLQTIGNCAQVTKPRPELLFLIQDPVFFFPKRYGPAGFLFLLLLSQFFFFYFTNSEELGIILSLSRQEIHASHK